MNHLNPTKLTQILKIKRLYKRAFPIDERKPFWLIQRMRRLGKTDVWYFEENGEFLGFAGTINGEHNGNKYTKLVNVPHPAPALAEVIYAITTYAPIIIANVNSLRPSAISSTLDTVAPAIPAKKPYIKNPKKNTNADDTILIILNPSNAFCSIIVFIKPTFWR